MDLHNILITLLVNALPVIFAITLHEAAHGYVAKHFGDATAYMLGRVTLNPIKHIDLLGTIVVPAITMLAGGFLFGWAKPVPVNYSNLRSPKRDSLWVAFAGPFANMVQVVIWAIVAQGAAGDRDDVRPGRAVLGLGGGSRDQVEHHVRAAQPAADPAARRRAHHGEPAAEPPLVRVFAAPSPTACSSCWRWCSPAPSAGCWARRSWPPCAAPTTSSASSSRAQRQQCSRTAFFPACAPRAPCTSATTTARSRTGCGCRTSTRASSSPPTGTRSPPTTRIPQVIEQTVWDMFVDWLAGGHRPDQVHALHPVARARSTPSSPCCCRSSRRCRWLERVPTYKDLVEQPRRARPRHPHLRLPRLPADAGGRHHDLPRQQGAGGRGPGLAHRAHARDRAALQPPLRAREGLRGEGRGGGEEDGPEEGQALPRRCAGASRRRATRPRSRRRRRWSPTCRTSRSATRSGSSATSRAAGA